jgi:two-component system cell cycle response regulator DivK
MAAPSILVPPTSMPMRNRADMARFPHADRLRIIKFDPLQSIECSRCGNRGCRIASPQRLRFLSGGARVMDKSVAFEAGSMTLDDAKPEVDTDRPVRKKVLIVEDNELNMKLFNDLLVAHGYGTLQTKDGVEALALARQHRPDLILMDIQLPEVSGLQVTQWIKEDADLRMIPVIAVTAFAMKGDEEKMRNGGCEAYIAKPISVTSFLQTVERFLS